MISSSFFYLGCPDVGGVEDDGFYLFDVPDDHLYRSPFLVDHDFLVGHLVHDVQEPLFGGIAVDAQPCSDRRSLSMPRSSRKSPQTHPVSAFIRFGVGKLGLIDDETGNGKKRQCGTDDCILLYSVSHLV